MSQCFHLPCTHEIAGPSSAWSIFFVISSSLFSKSKATELSIQFKIWDSEVFLFFLFGYLNCQNVSWVVRKMYSLKINISLREVNSCCFYKDGSSCLANRGSDIHELPCIFPFKYVNNVYEQCIWNGRFHSWCATEIDEDGFLLDKNWGYCNRDCPAYENPRSKYLNDSIPGCHFESLNYFSWHFILFWYTFRLQHSNLWKKRWSIGMWNLFDRSF